MSVQPHDLDRLIRFGLKGHFVRWVDLAWDEAIQKLLVVLEELPDFDIIAQVEQVFEEKAQALLRLSLSPARQKLNQRISGYHQEKSFTLFNSLGFASPPVGAQSITNSTDFKNSRRVATAALRSQKICRRSFIRWV